MSSKATLRIFADCHVFDGTLQGSTTYLKGLYAELIKDTSKVFYLAATDTNNLKKIFGAHDHVIYIQYRSANKFIRLLIDIPAIIRKHKIDFAHFQYIVPPIKNCKFIVTTHDVLFMDFPQYFPKSYRIKNKLLFKASAKYADIVLTVSDYSKRQIQKHFGVSNITITPNAVDPVFFETYDKAEAIDKVAAKYGFSNYWLFVSRWEPRKNHLMLLKAFVENKFYEQYQLVFVGDPAIPNPAYDAYFADLDDTIKQKITALHKVNFEDLLLLVRGASLSAYPSVAEGFGIPPLEALAAGIPAICSDTTAMADFDFMGEMLFNPLDAIDIANKATAALAQKEVSSMRVIVRERYNWSLAAAQFQKAISQ